jgi:hypothetical protein
VRRKKEDDGEYFTQEPVETDLGIVWSMYAKDFCDNDESTQYEDVNFLLVGGRLSMDDITNERTYRHEIKTKEDLDIAFSNLDMHLREQESDSYDWIDG